MKSTCLSQSVQRMRIDTVNILRKGNFKCIQQTVTSTRKMDSDNSIVCKYRQNGATSSTSLPQSCNTHSTTRIKSQDKTHAPKPGSQNILRRPISTRKMDSENSIVCKYRQYGATPSTSLPQLYSNTHTKS